MTLETGVGPLLVAAAGIPRRFVLRFKYIYIYIEKHI